MLFAISLKLEYCLAVIDESPEQTKAGLNHVVADLDGLITDLRDRIYEIQ
jgi:signal transduction histidine kinase